jgi:hypothetical protein
MMVLVIISMIIAFLMMIIKLTIKIIRGAFIITNDEHLTLLRNAARVTCARDCPFSSWAKLNFVIELHKILTTNYLTCRLQQESKLHDFSSELRH